MNAQRVGKIIQELRKGRGITQEDAAAAIGIARPTLAGIEKGHDKAGLETLLAIADYYKVSMDLLTLRESEITDQREREIVRLFSGLPSTSKDKIYQVIRSVVDVVGVNQEESSPADT